MTVSNVDAVSQDIKDSLMEVVSGRAVLLPTSILFILVQSNIHT